MVLQDFSTAVEEDFFSHHYKLAFHKESYRLYLETVDLVGKVFLTLSYSELWRLHWQSTCSSYSLSLSLLKERSPHLIYWLNLTFSQCTNNQQNYRVVNYTTTKPYSIIQTHNFWKTFCLLSIFFCQMRFRSLFFSSKTRWQ